MKQGMPVPVQGIFLTVGAMEQKIRIISTESMVVKALPVLIQTNQPINRLRPIAKAHIRHVSRCSSLRRCMKPSSLVDAAHGGKPSVDLASIWCA